MRFDKVLFLGSSLPRRFRWDKTINRIGLLLNLIGSADKALLMARYIPGLGDAGRRGFYSNQETIIQEKEPFSTHSDLFGKEFMKDCWLPFLCDGSTNSLI